MPTATAHKLTAAIAGLFALAGTACAQTDARPVIIDDAVTDISSTLTDAQSNERWQQRRDAACHVFANFAAYDSYLAATVHPRIAADLGTLTAAHTKPDGTPFHMAEAIDNADLFHTHVMLPYIPAAASPGLEPAFLPGDPRLHYHTMEYNHRLRTKWSDELRGLNDPEINQWLARIKAANNASIAESAWLNNHSQQINPALVEAEARAVREAALTDTQRARFANLWATVPGTPEIWQLKKRLRDLDPSAPDTDIHAYRSITATESTFTIIKPLEDGTTHDVASVYFDERADNPAIETVIRRAESLGIDTLYNPDARMMHRLAPALAHVDWAVNDELYAAFRDAAANGNPLGSFRPAAADPTYNNDYTVRWDSKNIYSNNYYNMDHCAPR